MSNDNEDKSASDQGGLSKQSLSPVFDWGPEPIPSSAEEQVARGAAWQATKDRVRDADPKTLGAANKFAHYQAKRDDRKVAKAAKAAQDAGAIADVGGDGAEQSPKPRRARKVATAAASQGPDAPKPAHAPRRKAAAKAAEAVAGNAIAQQEAPSVTLTGQEAAYHLANKLTADPEPQPTAAAGDMQVAARQRFDQVITESEHWLSSNGKTADFAGLDPAGAMDSLDMMMGHGTSALSEEFKAQGRALWDKASAAYAQFSRHETQSHVSAAVQDDTVSQEAKIDAMTAKDSNLHPPAFSDPIPPITQKAMAFLNSPDQSANALLRLHPEDRAFAEYHLSNMDRLDKRVERGWERLAAAAGTMSPAWAKLADKVLNSDWLKKPPTTETSRIVRQDQVVADAVLPKRESEPQREADQVAPPTVVPEPPASYAPKQLPFSHHVTAAIDNVQMSLQTKGENLPRPVPDNVWDIHAERASERATRDSVANHIAGDGMVQDQQHLDTVYKTAIAMVSSRIRDVSRDVAVDLVTSDVAAVQAIMSEQFSTAALGYLDESSVSQPHYKAELERQAPDLARQAAIASDRQAPVAEQGQVEVENSIERGPAIQRPEKQETKPTDKVPPAQQQNAEPAPNADAVQSSEKGLEQGQQGGVSKRFLRILSNAASQASIWLADRANGTVPGPQVKGVDLAKDATQQRPVAPLDDNAYVVPEDVQRRFLKVERDYYFSDRSPAFSDKGEKLTTRGEHPEVMRSLVEIAKARGWDSIMVKGKGGFPRKMWLEASQAGLHVDGYKPTDLDLAELARRPSANSIEESVEQRAAKATIQAKEQASSKATSQAANADAGQAPPQPQSKVDSKEQVDFVVTTKPKEPTIDEIAAGFSSKGYTVGQVVEHGAAKYKNDPDEKLSYYVKLDTPTGQKTEWGVDLKRAMHDGGFKMNDLIALRRVRKDTVEVEAKVRDAKGDVIGTESTTAKRNQWDVQHLDPTAKKLALPGAEQLGQNPEMQAKANSFANDKPSFVVKKHPDLAPAYGVLAVAKAFAEEKLPEEAREEFVALARRHVMQKIMAGEQVQGPQITIAPPKTKEPASLVQETDQQSKAPTEAAADMGKSPRSKEPARER